MGEASRVDCQWQQLKNSYKPNSLRLRPLSYFVFSGEKVYCSLFQDEDFVRVLMEGNAHTVYDLDGDENETLSFT